jgi:hypothetical protein
VHDALSSIAELFDELVHRLVREECSTRGARRGYIELYSTTVGRTQIRAISYSYHRSQLSGNAELQYFSEMGEFTDTVGFGPECCRGRAFEADTWSLQSGCPKPVFDLPYCVNET